MIKDDCIFCKIANGIIKTEPLYSDENMVIIRDIHPCAKIHLLLIPKAHFADITEMSGEEAVILGKCLKKLGEIAGSLGLEEGFRLISNKGENACQSVRHLHIHILGGEKLGERLV